MKLVIVSLSVTILMIFCNNSLLGQQIPAETSSPFYYKDGKAGIGTADPQQNVQIFFPYGTGKYSQLFFGDNNTWERANTNGGLNCMIGEYGTTDTDQLQLHGKKGLYFTTGNYQFGNYTIAMQLSSSQFDGSTELRVNGNISLGNQQVDSYLKINSTPRNWWIGSGIVSGDGKFVIYDQTQSKHRFSIDGEGNVGVGVTNAKSSLHVASKITNINSVSQFDANMIIEGTSTSRDMTQGASLGFVVPANTDGSNPWQQGRIIVTPGNTQSGNADGKMYIQTRSYGNNNWIWRNNLVLTPNSFVGINTPDPQYQLDVNGTIRSKEIKVETFSASNLNIENNIVANKLVLAANGQTADYVFTDSYELMSLNDVEGFINKNKHLPDVPSAKAMEQQGVDIAEMNKILLQKIEELTLYMIQQQKEISGLKKTVNTLKE